jgi:Zn-dependent protease with chaperone function
MLSSAHVKQGLCTESRSCISDRLAEFALGRCGVGSISGHALGFVEAGCGLGQVPSPPANSHHSGGSFLVVPAHRQLRHSRSHAKSAVLGSLPGPSIRGIFSDVPGHLQVGRRPARPELEFEDILVLAMWSTIALPVPLITVAVGVQDISRHRFVGVGWMFFAAVAALGGSVGLRSAEGYKPRAVKSGQLYKRAFGLARRIGIPLRKVSVVPFGKGRLTNAYGGYESIALTDDYGHWLEGLELDFVIGHELAHVKGKHALKKLAGDIVVFALVAILALFLPQSVGTQRIVFHFGVILAPLALTYLLSRYFEYTCDRLSVE